MIHSKSKRLLGSLLTIIPLAGCGNYMGNTNSYAVPKSAVASTSTYSDSSGNGGHPDQTDYTCPTPAAANILPRYSDHGPGVDTYTACPSNKNSADLLFYGTPYRADKTAPMPQVCVFPIDYVDENHVVPKFDPYFWPMVTCVAYNANGMKVSFASTHYNAVVIVTQADSAATRNCLHSGSFDTCPAYSRGVFR